MITVRFIGSYNENKAQNVNEYLIMVFMVELNSSPVIMLMTVQSVLYSIQVMVYM